MRINKTFPTIVAYSIFAFLAIGISPLKASYTNDDGLNIVNKEARKQVPCKPRPELKDLINRVKTKYTVPVRFINYDDYYGNN